jgi:hypothetical protein
VLTSGSAIAANYAAEHAAALLEAWYGGEETGTAIAETLAGINNPAGRLPVTFYKTLDQLPPFTDYAMKGRTYRYFKGDPLYTFGFGLSYSNFTYSGLSAKRTPQGAENSRDGQEHFHTGWGRSCRVMRRRRRRSRRAVTESPRLPADSFARAREPAGKFHAGN